MTPEETKNLLAKAALHDHRTVDLMTIKAWHEVIQHLDYADAMAALTQHRAETTDYLQPAHIVQGARRIRADRVTAAARDRARQSAIEAPARQADLTDADLRKRIRSNPAFMRAFEQGRVEGNAERAYWTELRASGNSQKALAAKAAVRAAAES